MDSKATIRAVLAALLLSSAILVGWINSRSPMTPLLGAGDLYIELNRPGAAIERLSNATLATQAPGGEAAAMAGLVENFSRDLGGAWDFAIWNLDSAITVVSGGGSIVAINPGTLAPLRNAIFHGAGFVNDQSGDGALVKDGVQVVSKGGFWLIGRPDALSLIGADDEKTRLARDKIKELRNGEEATGRVGIFVLPTGIEKLSADFFGADAPRFLENWFSLSMWKGVALSVGAKRRKISVKGKIVAHDTPLPDLFKKIKRRDDFNGLIHPGTERIFLVAAPSPAALMNEALDLYKERAEPKMFITAAATEIKRELGLDILDVAKVMRREFGYVSFNGVHGEGLALVAGVGLMAQGDFDGMEKTISKDGWQTTAKGEVRFLKRLLAYKLRDGHVYMAYNTKILQDYLDGLDRHDDVPDDLNEIAEKLNYASIFYGGSLKSSSNSTNEAKIENDMSYFGVALARDGEDITIDGELWFPRGEKIRPPIKIMLLIVIFGILRTAVYLSAAIGASSLVFRTAQVYRSRKTI